MIRVLLLGFGVLGFGLEVAAQGVNDGDRLWFDVTLEPSFVASEGAYVGGEIILDVRFVSFDPFKRVRLDVPVIEGVRAEPLSRARTRQIEILGDEGYTLLGNEAYSHGTRIAIVPQRSGAIVIPPIRVTGLSEPVGGQSFRFEKVYPEQQVMVHPMAPDFGGADWVVSREVAIEDRWSHAITEIRNGDTVRRTVLLTVSGVTADDLPELVLEPGEGHRVLSTEVAGRTERTDAGFVAHLEQSWDIYVATEDITYINGVRFLYWNPERAATEEVSVPPERVEPLKRDALALRQSLREEALKNHEVRRLGLLGLFLIPVAGLAIVVLLVLWRALPTRADLRFWRVSRTGPPPLQLYRSFLAWGRDTFGPDTVTGREQVRVMGDRASDHVDRLHRSIFGRRNDPPSPRRMAAVLILASRRVDVAQFLSSMMSAIAGFLFLR